MERHCRTCSGFVLGLAVALGGTLAVAQGPAPAAPAGNAVHAAQQAEPAPAVPADSHSLPTQPPKAGEPAAPHQAAAAHAPAGAEHGGDAEHGRPILEMLAKLLNFGILAGTMVYFLRSPFNRYLADRGAQIRADLVKAADMKAAAAAQVTAVEEKMAALPSELEALRTAGAAEVAAEEARIRAAGTKERERLLTQMQREIDLHGKAAERDLLRLAADKAVGIATAEVTRTMTPADHARLVERYVEMVGK